MTIKNQKCICVADPKCYWCRGEGVLTIDVAHDRPPVPTSDCDWQATIQDSETGPQGYGATKVDAVKDLMVRLWEVSN